MLSFVCLPLFIILVYVSGSTINDIETLSISTTKDSVKTFIKPTTLATTITTPPVTIELSSTLTIPAAIEREHHHPLQLSESVTSTTSTFLSTTTVSSTSSSTGYPSTSTVISLVQATKSEGTVVVPKPNNYLNITSQAGTHAYLPCNVRQIVDKPVSWIRVRDGHILTVDQTTFIADERFQSIYTQNPERWSLQIKFVQTRDAGSYECQVSTEPKMSARVQLNVIEPKTEFLGESIRHVKAGSRVILRCIVSGALEPPLFINWFFDRKQIYLHNKNSWRTELNREMAFNGNSSNHSDKQNTTASLIIPSVTKKDSGNYTCSPSNSESITVVLHVLNGEYSASAITSGCDVLYQFHIRDNWIKILYFIFSSYLCRLFKM